MRENGVQMVENPLQFIFWMFEKSRQTWLGRLQLAEEFGSENVN